jgi:hypothetical protein
MVGRMVRNQKEACFARGANINPALCHLFLLPVCGGNVTI